MTDDRRARIDELIADLRSELESIDAAVDDVRAARANGGDDDEHDPDGVPLSATLESYAAQRVRTQEQLRQARLALAGIDAGTYGRCERCGREIPAARLEIRPAARRCVACAG